MESWNDLHETPLLFAEKYHLPTMSQNAHEVHKTPIRFQQKNQDRNVDDI